MQATGPSLPGIGVGASGLFNQPADQESPEPEPQSTAIITCPKKMVGRVIGKNGETIKALQNFTGAQIQIDQRLDPTRVSIAGPPKALIQANNMVQDIVAGTFKGFAMLRAYANQGSRANSGYDLMAQQAPMYIKGYGFVPPSQFSGDPLEGGVLPAYGDTFAQQLQSSNFAAQNGFPAQNGFSTQYQNGLSAMMPQNHYGAMDQYQIALAQAQLLAASQRMTSQMTQMPAAAGVGFPQAVPGYMINPPAGYRATDSDSLAAQLEAMSVNETSNLPMSSAARHSTGLNSQIGLNGQNPRSSAQSQVRMQSGGQTNYSL